VVTHADGAQGTPYQSTEILRDQAEVTTVYQNSSGGTISEPSNFSNNGNATTRDWESEQ
jgi:hypothetical protein